jgi:hypothetical protein
MILGGVKGLCRINLAEAALLNKMKTEGYLSRIKASFVCS